MKQRIAILLCVLAAVLLCACQQSATLAQLDEYVDNVIEKLEAVPSFTPTPEPTEETADEPSPSPTAAAAATPTPTATSTPKPKSTQRPTPTPHPSLSPTPTPTPSPSPSPKSTPAPTPKPSPASTPASTPTPTPSPSEAPPPQSVPFKAEPSPTPTPEPEPEPEPEPRNPISATGAAAGSEIAAFAKQYIGTRYKWGGTDPETGFDCSGFVYFVYSQYGYTLSRVAADMASNGTHVDEESIAVGDVICFYNQGSGIGHVGIYLGDGMYIHSQDSSTGVVISPLSARTCKIEIRRIVE